MQIQIRKTSVNPFLVSPIIALVDNKAVYVNHAYKVGNEIHFAFDHVDHEDGKTGSCSIKNIEFFEIDLGKLEKLVKMAR